MMNATNQLIDNDDLRDFEWGDNESMVTPSTATTTWSSATTLSASFRLNAPQRDDSTFVSSLTGLHAQYLDQIEEQSQSDEPVTAERNSFASTFSVEIPSHQQLQAKGISTASAITEGSEEDVKSSRSNSYFLNDRIRHSQAGYATNIPVAESTEFAHSAMSDEGILPKNHTYSHSAIQSSSLQLALSSPMSTRSLVSAIFPSTKPESEVGSPDRSPRQQKKCWIQWTLRYVVTVLLIGLVTAVVILCVDLRHRAQNSHQSGAPSNNRVAVSTADMIRERGYLMCGVIDQTGFSAINQTTHQRVGFEIDLCRAVGAAIFGKDGYVRFAPMNFTSRFDYLQSSQVDLLAARIPFTIQSDVYEPSTGTGFTFSTPYLYTGVGFAGHPSFVNCADALSTTGNCSGLVICVQYDTMHVDVVQSLFPGFAGVVLAPTQQNLYLDFVGGQCNVIAGEEFDLSEVIVRQAGYTGNYSIGNSVFSSEPLSLVTRDDDVHWSDFVDWVLLCLLTAEVQHMTQSTAINILNDPSVSVDPNDVMFIYAVATVGNYGEMYQRNLESIVPRAPVNKLNNGSSPLVYPIPFGNMSINGPGPVPNGTLDTILQRGYLRCGITTAAFFSGFNISTQEWSGMDIDFCLAVSAALFQGLGSTIFVPVTAAERFEKLASGELDLLSRVTSITYDRNVQEPTTGQGFSFSQPDFYSGVQFGGIPPYNQCADNVDVSSAMCAKLKICVTNGTTTIDRVRALFPERYFIAKTNKQLVAECLVTGEGNAIAVDGFDTASSTIRAIYSGPYEPGTKLFSRENFALVTRQDDPQWSSFVYLVVTATFYAEQQGITQRTFQRMPLVNLFGSTFPTMLQSVIEAVGSYAEIFDRNANSRYPRTEINKLNTNPPGPQHYPPPGLLNLF